MYVKVRVKTKTARESLKCIDETHFEISVREEAKENRANDRVRAILARHFHVTDKKVRLVSGHQRPSKLFSITL